MASRREHELLLKLQAALGSNFNSSFQNAINTTNRLQGSISNLKKTQGDISAYQATEERIRSLREEKARLESQGGNNEAAIARVNRQLAEQEGRLRDVSGRLQEAGIDTNRLSEESGRLKAAQERLVRSQEDLARATQAVEANKKSLNATKRDLLVTMGKVTVAAAAIYVGAIQPAANFQSSMADVQAQTGMTSEEIQELGNTVRYMGRNSRHGGQEIADALAAVALHGQDVAHSTELMRTAMVLADATGKELRNTAYFLGAYLDKIGKDASYAERYINVFAATVRATNIPLNTLQDYLFRANATLQMAGVSGTEATAIFGNLYRAGIQGANAYSGFQQVLQSLMLPSDNAAAALNRLGICVQSMKAAGYDMTEIMFRVGDALEYVEDNTERLALMNDMFTQQSAQAFADEVFNQRNALRDLIPELYAAGDAAHGMGVAYQMAADRNATFEAQMAQARNVMNDVRISIGTALLPAITDLMSGFAESAGRVAEWAAENQDLILILAKVAAGLAAAKIAFLAIKVVYLQVKGVVLAVKKGIAAYNAVKALMTVATGKATVAQMLFNKAMLLNPIGLVIAAIAAIIAIIVLLVRNWDTVREAAQRVWQVIKDVFGRVRDFFVGVWERMKEIPARLFNWFKDNWQAILLFIINPFAGVFKFLYDNFEGFRNFVDNIVDRIRTIFTNLGAAIKNIFSTAVNAIKGFFTAVPAWFLAKFTEAWNAIKGVFAAVGDFFRGIWETIKGIFTSIGSTIGDAIGNAFSTVVNSIIGFAEGLLNRFINGINRAIGVINRIPGVNISLLEPLDIPRLWRGANRTPDTFVAGDIRGKGGELITGAKGRKVFTNAQTKEIFNNINKAKTINKLLPSIVSDSDTRPRNVIERVSGMIGGLRSAALNRTAEMIQPPLPDFPSYYGGGESIICEFSTVVHVNGDTPGDLDEKLKKNNENLMAQFKEFLRKQREDERRKKYA